MADGLSSGSQVTEFSAQFTDLFTCIPFKVTFEDASVAAGAIYDGAAGVTVTGASLGDFVLVAPEVDLADAELSADVTAANTVTILNSSNTGSASTSMSGGVVVNGIVLSLKGRFKEIT